MNVVKSDLAYYQCIRLIAGRVSTVDGMDCCDVWLRSEGAEDRIEFHYTSAFGVAAHSRALLAVCDVFGVLCRVCWAGYPQVVR